jgi:hypothetical protein
VFPEFSDPAALSVFFDGKFSISGVLFGSRAAIATTIRLTLLTIIAIGLLFVDSASWPFLLLSFSSTVTFASLPLHQNGESNLPALERAAPDHQGDPVWPAIS